jgi:hypothetical protein
VQINAAESDRKERRTAHTRPFREPFDQSRVLATLAFADV